MYLLNLNAFAISKGFILFTFHYVSIKSIQKNITPDGLYSFTFHYVSIKSKNLIYDYHDDDIYIPLCIY